MVGLGLGGPAAAIGIRKVGCKVMVLEWIPELREVCKWSLTSLPSPTNSYSVHQVDASLQVPPLSSKILKGGAFWKTSSYVRCNLGISL